VSIGFTPLAHDDLVQLHVWLQRPHVARWWRDLDTYEKVVADHLPALEGREPTDHFLIVVDGRPIGMIQAYLVADHPEWEAIVAVGSGVAGVDLFIGEEYAIGRGLGPEILRAFLSEVVFAKEGTHACVAGVETENARSLRAFEKAGFRAVRDYSEEGRPHTLMRIERRT
jgi:RimJ/RimL family protein N-acetyltransferase